MTPALRGAPKGPPLPQRPRHALLAVALVAVALLVAGPASAGKVEIKLATSIPANTPFHKLLTDLGTEWQTISNGDVTLVTYPGGVAGDESDVIRKIRIGQLHAGAIT